MDDRIWLVIMGFVSLISFLFITLYFTSQLNMIPASQCSSSTGTYGVRPNKTGTVTRTVTGVTLGQAITTCDLDSSCSAFSYNSASKSMYVIDATKPIVDAVTLDLYQSRITR